MNISVKAKRNIFILWLLVVPLGSFLVYRYAPSRHVEWDAYLILLLLVLLDMEFGSGAVKITPAHDPNDFEIGNRHNLQRILVMNEDGTMNKNAAQYDGMDRFACRKQIVKDLQDAGVLFKIEEHMHSGRTRYSFCYFIWSSS